jgi:glutathione peroxidase-family protein
MKKYKKLYNKLYKKKPGVKRKARISWHYEKDKIIYSNNEIIEYLEKIKKAEIVNE